jgi:hypothetical protein
MGAAASIGAQHVPAIKEAYEAKKAEEGITDEALFDFMSKMIADLPKEDAPVAEVAAENPAAEASPVAEGDAAAAPAEAEAEPAPAAEAPAEAAAEAPAEEAAPAAE